MVGPSLSESDRAAGMNRLRAGVVLLVAGSGTLVALYADAGLPFVAAGALGGAALGLALWYYMVWAYRDGTSRQDRERDSSYEKRERFD
ncbi:hypothetical protein [Halorubellus sp. PRR65]|uniref:hypothetical protein n=1 Tax=Halorubellus sp. PRR65 TaxID=3098148 RepID=UPI002B2628D2|nr:hypothetical protein [Halorubellus sp. PRR65]